MKEKTKNFSVLFWVAAGIIFIILMDATQYSNTTWLHILNYMLDNKYPHVLVAEVLR